MATTRNGTYDNSIVLLNGSHDDQFARWLEVNYQRFDIMKINKSKACELEFPYCFLIVFTTLLFLGSWIPHRESFATSVKWWESNGKGLLCRLLISVFSAIKAVTNCKINSIYLLEKGLKISARPCSIEKWLSWKPQWSPSSQKYIKTIEGYHFGGAGASRWQTIATLKRFKLD